MATFKKLVVEHLATKALSGEYFNIIPLRAIVDQQWGDARAAPPNVKEAMELLASLHCVLWKDMSAELAKEALKEARNIITEVSNAQH